MTHLAGSLGITPSLMNPGQICQAIAPLAETLFPTPRIPIYRTHLNEGWIVFEESPNRLMTGLKKRTTLKSYHPSTPTTLYVDIPTHQESSIPSAPLRQTSSGELMGNPPERGDVPQSAGLMGKGKKSFLRPLLLGGRKKRDKAQAVGTPTNTRHQSRKEEIRKMSYNVIDTPHVQGGYEGIEDDYLHVEGTVESPYEETAFISDDPVPEWAPLAAKNDEKKKVSKRVVELGVEATAEVPSSPVAGGTTPRTPLTPVTFPINSPVIPSPVLSPVLSPILSPVSVPVSTPVTASMQIIPTESDARPRTIEPVTPMTPPIGIVIPVSPVISSAPSTPIPDTPVVALSRSAEREPSTRKSDRSPDHKRVRELKHIARGERESGRREAKGERESKSKQSKKIEAEISWLEQVFEDLPFGPDKNMVSPPYHFCYPRTCESQNEY